MSNETKWMCGAPLKSRWYDDHFGNDASVQELGENKVPGLEDRVLKGQEEDPRSREVERFFDLFDPREPQS